MGEQFSLNEPITNLNILSMQYFLCHNNIKISTLIKLIVNAHARAYNNLVNLMGGVCNNRFK